MDRFFCSRRPGGQALYRGWSRDTGLGLCTPPSSHPSVRATYPRETPLRLLGWWRTQATPYRASGSRRCRRPRRPSARPPPPHLERVCPRGRPAAGRDQVHQALGRDEVRTRTEHRQSAQGCSKATRAPFGAPDSKLKSRVRIPGQESQASEVDPGLRPLSSATTDQRGWQLQKRSRS